MSFLRDYAQFSSGNEASPLYHIWSAIGALSAIISRRVWIEQGIFTYYPNMYIVLVGGPGNGKSTAMNIAKKMVRALKDIPLAATAVTKEALVREMSDEDSPCKKSFKRKDNGQIEEYTAMTIFATELTHFMAVNPIGMVDFLTTIYDEPVYEVKTKNQGNDLMLGPFITMLSCMTPDITSSYIKANIISGGFARRAVFVWSSERGEPVPFPKITKEQAEAWDRCIEWANKLKKVSGPFKWTEESRAWYEGWYINLRKVVIPGLKDPMLRGYYESKHVQLFKVAMMVALSESTDLILEKHHLQIALEFLEEVENNLGRVFEGTGRNELSGVASKILEFIESRKGPVTRKQVLSSMFREADRTELDKIIFHLIDSDQLVKISHNTGNGFVELLAVPDVARKLASGEGVVVQTPDSLQKPKSSLDQKITIDL